MNMLSKCIIFSLVLYVGCVEIEGEDILIELSVNKTKIHLEEQIECTVLIRNCSDSTIYINKNKIWSWLYFQSVYHEEDEDAVFRGDTITCHGDGFSEPNYIELKINESFQNSLNLRLDKLANFSDTYYEFYIKIDDYYIGSVSNTKNGSKSSISNKIEFKILR